MPINHFITHHIVRKADTETSLEIGTHEIVVDDQTEQLIHALKGSFFSRLSREHGSFDSQGDPSTLSRGLDVYLEQKQSFVELTIQLMEQLKTLLDEKGPEIDAHVICFAEKNADAQLFYLLFAGHKTAFTIGTGLTVESTQYLDLGASLFGIKVDMTEWLTNKNYAYLSLVPPQGNRKLADIFNALTGFTPGLDKTDSTEAFLAGVEAFARQVPEDHLDGYRNQVVDYCSGQEERDAPIDLHELSQSVEGIDGDNFTRFMSDYTPGGENALMVDRRSLRRYVKFTGRERDLAISFSASQLNSRVHYNPDKDTLSIDGIPRSLRDQLLKHLNK